MNESHRLDDEADLLAAELALGLLDGDERAAALRRHMADPAFRARVEQWRAHALGWAETIDAEPVDERVWQRIEAALGDAPAAAEPYAEVAPIAPAVSRTPWRPIAVAAAAAALLLAVTLGMVLTQRPATVPAASQPPPIAAAPPVPVPAVQPQTQQTQAPALADAAPPAADVAQIAGKKGAPLLSAVYYRKTGTLLMKVAEFDEPEKAPELWVIDKAGKPHSLGLLDEGSSVTIKLSADLRKLLIDGATMAITLEDRDGAPHDAPTGKILGTAELSTL